MDSYSIFEVIKTEKPVHLPTFRYDIYGDDGKIMVPKFWNAYSYPIPKEGKVYYILHRLEDVTDNVKKNQMTFERADIFKVMVDNVKDYAMFMLDTNGYIRSWNLGAKRLKGYDAVEIIGKQLLSILS